MPIFGHSILRALRGLGQFQLTKVPRGSEPSAGEAESRGPTELKTCVKALRAAGGTSTEKYNGVGITVLEGMPKLNLSYDRLDKLFLCAAAQNVRDGSTTGATRMDYGPLQSLRWFLPMSFGSSSETGRGAELWQHVVTMADDDDDDAETLVEWSRAVEPVVSRAYGKPMRIKSGTAVRVAHKGFSATHGDGPRFEARTVSVVMDEPHATKRVSIGLARDSRGWSRGLLSPSRWIYLGDLVLRNKDTYIGDRVAMGAERVGWSLGCFSSALVHRVNPVEGAEWVLILDWVPVEE